MPLSRLKNPKGSKGDQERLRLLNTNKGEKGVIMDTSITIKLTPEQYNTVMNVATILDWGADDFADVFYDAMLGQAAHYHIENNV